MTEVYNDAQSASKGEHKMAMEHLFTKLFSDEVDDQSKTMSKMLDQFWEDYGQFTSKTGPYGGCDHIWVSQDIVQGKSYMWHMQKKYWMD